MLLSSIHWTEAPFWHQLIATLASALLVYLYLQYTTTYSYWSRRKVKGPKPWPLVGNLCQLMDKASFNLEWTKQFGRIYGVYLGSKPVLVIADPEVIVQICVKDFENFQNKEAAGLANVYLSNSLIWMRGRRWKETRALMSPAFTSSKIRRMFLLMGACVDDLMAAFREQLNGANASSVVNVKRAFDLFAMDTITSCCYSLKLKRSGSAKPDSREEFVCVALRMLNPRLMRSLTAAVVPKALLSRLGFLQDPLREFEPLARKVSRLVDARKSGERKSDDFLQLLVDANSEPEKRQTEDKKPASDQADESRCPALSRARLQEAEVLANGMDLLSVVLDTSSNLLSGVAYALAHHQHVQSRLYDELLKIAEFDEHKTKLSFSYHALSSCLYLDAVISESLRRLPLFYVSRRVAANDYYIDKYKLHVSAGQALSLNWHSVMNDCAYWHEPERFDPERFMAENKHNIVPGSYAPFGFGPRHCLAMRYTLTESKLALANMLVNFKLEPAPGSSFPPPLRKVFITAHLERPEVRLVPRN